MERLTKRTSDGQAVMDCKKCKADWTEKHGESMEECTALYCRNRLKDRIAAYEDTELMPENVEALKLSAMGKAIAEITEFDGLPIDRLRELAEADKAGRLVVLPCKPDGSMLDTSDPERPEIMKRIHFAVAYVCGGIVFHQPYNMFLENVAAGYIRPLNEEAEKALEAAQND